MMFSLAVMLLLAVFAEAQIETVINNAGATVVQDVTQNPAGIPTTRVIETILPSTSLTTTALTTTSPLLQQTTSLALVTTTPQQAGPVGQPGTTPVTPGGPTPYQYTTTDASGNTVVVQGVFTPTGPQVVLPVPTTTGTIMGYSQWLSSIGTHTAPASAARRMSTPVATGWCYFAATAFTGLVGGAWLIVF